ncbi:DUF2254 domain-containing protein [Aureimonas mangrovi]|uniref:DUF2254 domain-containing protein n=1 Tax=Aureimonas mangrovi TaxID=2758041 RepID=UPI00163DBB76|nr:DUF2254 domain-containing protein [Aureimonas mangrovi]
MHARIQSFLAEIRASYWFIPAAMALAAALAALVLVSLDARFEAEIRAALPFIFVTQADGARAVLSAVASSMIGVAGTVFSITIAAVVYASGNYGPRILTNFMNDRGNQFTLGTFTATYLYALLVLRTVRAPSGDDAPVQVDPFVPILATFGGTLLAIASVCVLIFFIHHVPSNIHVSNVVAGIGRSLTGKIAERFPKRLGMPPQEPAERARALWQLPPSLALEPSLDPSEPAQAEIEAQDTGYIQIIDEDALVAIAKRHEVVVRLNVRPGAFLHPDRIVFDVFPIGRVSEELAVELRGTLALGAKRTSTHDLLFLFDELVEIGARALSPGVNDPYTAVNCIDWLGAALADLAGRDAPDPLRLDEDGQLRVVALPLDFEAYLEHSFGNLRQYAAADMIAGAHFLATLAKIARSTHDPMHLAALRAMGDRMMETARDGLSGPSLAHLEKRERELHATLVHPRRRIRLGSA